MVELTQAQNIARIFSFISKATTDMARKGIDEESWHVEIECLSDALYDVAIYNSDRAALKAGIILSEIVGRLQALCNPYYDAICRTLQETLNRLLKEI